MKKELINTIMKMKDGIWSVIGITIAGLFILLMALPVNSLIKSGYGQD